jgi:hypothetical protein
MDTLPIIKVFTFGLDVFGSSMTTICSEGNLWATELMFINGVDVTLQIGYIETRRQAENN